MCFNTLSQGYSPSKLLHTDLKKLTRKQPSPSFAMAKVCKYDFRMTAYYTKRADSYESAFFCLSVTVYNYDKCYGKYLTDPLQAFQHIPFL